ncbi:cache domain-containing sensor histidine kinase [Cohnella nanjingensis]|uniref:histidine kinase n=1 Tax=Cohnella nanjingensis TaxID=1387779 RepID=A0A7X0RRB5_9BACL|nr:sensor histidine kinase [Cohnella nanjingensis]MBB6670819.1 sensor histidine kinase [Cohnella nanjingensis]
MKRILAFKQKLVLTYVIFIVLPMSVLGLGAYRLYSQAMEKKVSDFVQQVAVSTSSNIEMYIRELEQFTLMPYYNRELQDMLTAGAATGEQSDEDIKLTLEKNFSFWQSQRGSIENITYFSKPGEGARRIYSLSYLLPGLSIEQMPWYDAFDDSDAIVATLSLHLPEANQLVQNGEPLQVFSLIRKIYYSSTLLKTAGYFQVDFTLEDIERIMSRVNSEKNGSFFVLDADRQVVYADDPVKPELLASVAGLQADSAVPQMIDLDKRKTIVVQHPVGKMGWTVVGYVPVSRIVSGIASVRNSMLLIGIVCIAIALVVSTGISYSMTKPIYRLISLIKRVEREDFQIEYDNPPRNELGQLIRSFIRMSRRLDETIRHLYQAEIVRKESELQALRSQINPHFLFNTLETIKMRAELDEADGTVDMITALGKLVRSSLQSGSDFITLQEEKDYLMNYLLIQENRYGGRFDITVRVEEALLSNYIPRLLVQPLIENAFYHGLEMKQGKGKLTVSITSEPDAVKVLVADDGLGIPIDRLLELRRQTGVETLRPQHDGGSIGLVNVVARIQLYFGLPYAMRIDSRPGHGTEVILLLPLIASESEVERYVSRYHRG